MRSNDKGTIVEGAAVALASIGAGAAAIFGVLPIVWLASGLVAISFLFSTVALIVALRSNERSLTVERIQQGLKEKVSSEADNVERTLRHGT